MFVTILFFLFYMIAVSFETKGIKNRNQILALACMIFAIMAGLRDYNFWPDALVYAWSFQFHTSTLSEFSFSDTPFGYSEFGFYFLQVIVRTFTDNPTVFFLIVSGVSFYFLYKGFKTYSIFPLIGLFAYISRFYFGRHFIQIRAGIAYAILMLSIKYILEKDWKRYFLIVFIAWLFHRSAFLAIPLYFICNWVNIKKWHVCVALIFSFLVGIWGQDYIHMLVEDSASEFDIGKRYTDAGGEKDQLEGLGMLNPIIYFQCIILLAYTFLEKRLAPLNKYYYIIRNAYLYSTMILICFCTYKVLSARSSTMYATLEYAIIPSLIYLFNKKNRMFASFFIGLALTAIFYMYTRGRFS